MEAVEFMKKLDELIELGRSKKDVLSIKEINDYFKGIESDSSKLSVKALYNHFMDLLVFNLDLDNLSNCLEFM